MAKRTAVDMKYLWELTQEGKSAKEIMQKMNLQDIDTVNNALEEIMQEKGLAAEQKAAPTGMASLNPRYTSDGIRISPAMLSGKGFKPGDQFRFKIEGNRIILEKEA